MPDAHPATPAGSGSDAQRGPYRFAVLTGHFPTRSPGSIVINQVRSLLEFGHSVTVFAAEPRKGTPLPDSLDRKNFEIRYRPRRSESVGPMLRAFTRRPVHAIHALNPVRFGGDALSLRLLSQYVPWMDAEPFHATIADYAHYGRIAVRLRQLGAPTGAIATVVRGSDASDASAARLRTVTRGADHIITISRYLRERVVRAGADPDQVTPVPLGIDIKPIAYRETRFIEGEPLRLITVARLIEMKGIQFVLRALSQLRDMHIDYTIVGEGPYRAALDGLIASHNLGAHVRFINHCSRSELFKIMGESHIHILPSVTTASGGQEGLGATTLEAMAIGLPVIGSRSGGIEEVIDDGVSGLLVPEGDADAIADALQRIVRDSNRWPAIGRAGREYVERTHDQAIHDKCVHDILCRIVERSNS